VSTVTFRTSAFGACAVVALAGIAGSGTFVRAQQPPGSDRARLTEALATLRGTVEVALPDAGAFTPGSRTVAAGERVGTVAVSGGALEVRGLVEGDAIAFEGDVIVRRGGRVSGSAVAIGGAVTLDGGSVDGATLMLGGDLAPAAPASAAPPRSRLTHGLFLASGWLGVLVVIGIGVLVFASTNLDAVSEALERHYGRALLAGVAGQLALVPALVLLLVALAVSLVGILLIPFAIVAYAIAACGALTLGYLAAARVTGTVWMSEGRGDERARRAASLRGLLIGLVVLLVPWFFAAVTAPWPVAEALVRAAALAVTWVAVTAGFGAVLLSRGGVRRPSAPEAERALATPGWQTPTPVSGVAAARRPTPLSSTGANSS
jgi:hypothetical protein